MKCPTCGENTPDAWERLAANLEGAANETEMAIRARLGGSSVFEMGAPGEPHPHRIHLDRMHCANPECEQLVVRGHDTYTTYAEGVPSETTETWLVHPRHASRPVDPLVLEKAPDLATDYAEAVAVLGISHRMSAVLARSILADLLERYAGLTDYGLADRVNKFIADDHRPSDLRQHLHYLREIADFGAHTQKNDQFERIKIDQDEAEWTLTIIERLFDHFIIAPATAERLRQGMDAKLEAAGRKPIKRLPLEEDGEESA
jgi:Domain of unknown function (DUF4145)